MTPKVHVRPEYMNMCRPALWNRHLHGRKMSGPRGGKRRVLLELIRDHSVVQCFLPVEQTASRLDCRDVGVYQQFSQDITLELADETTNMLYIYNTRIRYSENWYISWCCFWDIQRQKLVAASWVIALCTVRSARQLRGHIWYSEVWSGPD